MRKVLVFTFGLIPFAALALNYDAQLPYSDAPPDLATKVSVGALTEEGILEGNPDGTFRYTRLLDRAEFMQITMRLFPRIRSYPQGEVAFSRNCFPDVSAQAWYSEPVCKAKANDIVHGNTIDGVDPQFWLFEPSRPVQYEEALKVLINIFEVPILPACTNCIGPREWYEPYISSAEFYGLDLPFYPGHRLTRGEVSRLVARFLAYEQGELDALLQAEVGVVGSGEGEATEGTEDPDTGESGFESDDDSSAGGATYDQDANLSAKSDFLVLGEVSHVLGVAEVFSNAEPLDVTEITVVFTGASGLNSIEALRIYDGDGLYLGRANRDTGAGSRHYVLSLSHGTWIVPKRELKYLYTRAIVSGYRNGGVSGNIVQIDSYQVEGDGVWSNRSYSQSSAESFSSFQTTRSQVTSISNASDATGVLVPGTDLPIGSYRFEGETGDGSAELRVTDLTFNIEVNDDVSVSNVDLGADGTTDRHSCRVASNTATCSSIPSQFGSFKGAARVLTLYGDVSVPVDALSPRLSLTLNQPGSVDSAGSVTWTDGTTSFSWVPFGTPVARGTLFSW